MQKWQTNDNNDQNCKTYKKCQNDKNAKIKTNTKKIKMTKNVKKNAKMSEKKFLTGTIKQRVF